MPPSAARSATPQRPGPFVSQRTVTECVVRSCRYGPRVTSRAAACPAVTSSARPSTHVMSARITHATRHCFYHSTFQDAEHGVRRVAGVSGGLAAPYRRRGNKTYAIEHHDFVI